jgi:hypothetical protein
MALGTNRNPRQTPTCSLRPWRSWLLLALLCFLLAAAPVWGCFGPKLYIGVPATPQGELLFELVALYVKEKTGTESVRVALGGGEEPLAALRGEKVDLVFAAAAPGPEPALLQVSGLPPLLAGKRPLEDLQFTTVAPALAKLNRLLRAPELESLVSQVAQGAPPGATARKFLMAKQWI